MKRPILTLAFVTAILIGGALGAIWISAGSASDIRAPFGESPYHEIMDPSGFVNSPPFTLQSLVGKKVILLDFLTYSCINCQRTFPYLTSWYDAYEKNGLVIIGIHTPEFAFEKNIDNVEKAMQDFGIRFPIVLDNDYATWGAYGNRYWPHKYLIDIHGNIVYDHIGEGSYGETEEAIRKALNERAAVLGEAGVESTPRASEHVPEVAVQTQSPEVYFGSLRNDLLANGPTRPNGEIIFISPQAIKPNALYLDGKWTLTPEYALSGAGARIIFKYMAKDVYFVASADSETTITIMQDGKPLGSAAGEDVDTMSSAVIKDDRLYKIIHNEYMGVHTLEIRVEGEGLQAYTFTFG